MVKKIRLFVISILLILILSLSVTSAITGAMGNARMTLYPEVNGWKNTILEQTILIKNVNDVPINVTLEVDENSTDFLELIDDFYILQPNTEEKANFIVRVKKEGTYNGRINVFFRDSVKEDSPRIALVSKITIVAKKDQGYDEDEEDVTDEDQKDEDPVTGDIINEDDEKEPININPVTLMVLGSLVLLVVLLVLLSVMVKKSKKKVKINGKKKK